MPTYPKPVVSDLLASIYTGLGRSGLTVRQLAINALDWAAMVVALVFNPRELNVSGFVAITPGATTISPLSSYLTRWRVILIVNHPDFGICLPMVYKDMVLLTPASGSRAFYALYADSVIFSKTALAGGNIAINYSAYPTPIVDENTVMDFSGYDSFLISASVAICQTLLEESDAANLVIKTFEGLNVPLVQDATERNLLERPAQRLIDVYNAQ